jgi:2-dehydro-3-deoxy-D-pentonate aldolase
MRLSGVFTPNIVPLDDSGEINEPEYRRYLDWLIDRGVHGLYPNGSTGEFTRFTVEERRRIIRITCEQCCPRGIPVLAGASEANVRETIDTCALYREYGATAVAIVSPIYYRLGAESLYAYFAEIACNVSIDVTLYNIPMLASPIDVATVRRLADKHERIVGIKDSSGDVAHMARLVNAVRPSRPDFTFLTGWDVVLLPMMLVGADGGTNATSGVVPELMRRLYDLARQGLDGNHACLTQAVALQLRLIDLFDSMLYSADFPEGFRAGLEARGIRAGRGRQPLSLLQSEQKRLLHKTLQCLLSDFDMPGVMRPETCPPRLADAHAPTTGDRVARITRAVMQQLSLQRGER